MIRKYLVWWGVPLVILISIIIKMTIRQYDNFVPLWFFRYILSLLLGVLGFIYFFLAANRSKIQSKYTSLTTDFCRIYTAFFPLYILIITFTGGFVERNMAYFLNFNARTVLKYSFLYGIGLFLLVQIVALFILGYLVIRK